MYLKTLHLRNFRNAKKVTHQFGKGSTAIIAPNASGKSNVLEAIYLLATGKSVRADKDEELVQFEAGDARIEATIENESEQKLAVGVIRNPFGRIGKHFFVNGVKRRRIDFVGNLACVLFAPEDIDLIIDSPSIRREYINTVLSQVDKEYRQRLSRYEHAIRRRNKVLYFIREGKARSGDLDIWDRILVESGEKLVAAREAFFTSINSLNEFFPHIRWQYLPREITQEKLDQNRGRDIDAAQTLSGPHRDDFEFYDAERNLAAYGSRGEQRLAVLALKLVELAFVASKIGERPVLLLDDIFSELDEGHRKVVLDLLGKQQTILTSTEEGYIPKGKQIGTINLR